MEKNNDFDPTDILNSNANSTTNIPVDIPFDENLHTFYNESLPENMPGRSHEKPGFFKTLGGSFSHESWITQLAEMGDRLEQDQSPLDDYVDPNWSPNDDRTIYIGLDKRNVDYVMAATGPKDQRRRYNYALEHQEYNEKLSNGNLLAQLVGGGIGFAANPNPFSYIMVGKMAMRAKVAQGFLQDFPKMVAGAAVTSAAHEMVLETAKIGGNIEDWAINSFVDTAMATAFMGAHLGYSYASQGQKLYNARGVVNLLNKGIDAKPIIDEKGIVRGFKATPVDSSVGAAEVDIAQVYLDAALSRNFLYNIPYIGEQVGSKLGSGSAWLAGVISPKVRMNNSSFSSVRALSNNFAEHSFDTVGMERGHEIETPFETMIEIIRGTNRTMKDQYDGLFMKYNGIEYDANKFGSRTKANIIDTKDKIVNKDHALESRDTFNRAVTTVMVKKQPSDNAIVNEAAELLQGMRDPLYLEYLQLHNISDNILPPRGADGYASRVYYTARMEVEEERFIEELAGEFGKYDQEINSYLLPIKNLRNDIEQAEITHSKLIRNTDDNKLIKDSSDAIKLMKKKATRMEEDVQNSLRDNKKLDVLIEDRNAVSANEAKAIDGYLKPLNALEKSVNQQQDIVSKLKEQKGRKKQSAHKGKTADTAKKHAESEDDLAKQIEVEEAKLSDLKEKFDIESENLQDKMHNKQIPQELYYQIPDSFRYKFKDPSNRLKFRNIYESDHARKVSAKASYDSILNQTAEDNIKNLMNKVMSVDKENPLTERSLMVRDEFLHDNKWLFPDPSISVMNYRNYMGRQNAIKKILNRLTPNGTFEEYIQRFAREYTDRKNAIPKDLPKEKYEKAVQKLGREYKRNKDDVELVIGQMRNKSRYSAKGREYSRMANLFAVSTKLGFLGVTMMTDNQAIVFKHGPWRYVRDGLMPMLKNLGGMLNTSDAEVIRKNATHAHVADMHLSTAYSDKNWTGTSQTYEPVQGKLVTGLETLAHYSGNLSLANYIENGNQRWTALVVNTRIMDAMKMFLEGKLEVSNTEYKDLLRYGLDPKKFAERFRNEWKANGEYGNGFGGDIGKYWEWGDKEASNAMSQAILRATRDTIIRRGYLDAPFAMDNPLFNSIFLFKGYVLASMNRFLAPIMQQGQAKQLIGTTMMMAVGSTQNPLRRLAAGKDPIEEDEHMFRNAVRDGGVFSILGDVYEEMDHLTHGFLEETINNERYSGRTEMGVLNGPIGGILNDMTRITGMALSREWNQTDLKRVAVNIPWAYTWQFRALINKQIEETGLPKTRAKAHKANAV